MASAALSFLWRCNSLRTFSLPGHCHTCIKGRLDGRCLYLLNPKFQYSSGSSNIQKRLHSNEGQGLLPKEAKVVICGGGVVGSSVAYHLAERGWTDVVLLEQGRLTSGTTWHSVGLVGRVRSDVAEMRIMDYSKNLYSRLEKQGHGLGWKECGSLNIARTKDRLTDLKRKHAVSSIAGVETHMVTPSEINKLCPLIRYEDLEGGIWVPGDGVATAPDVAMVLSRLAKEKGVKIIEGVQVSRILTQKETVSAVETTSGKVKCEYFVNCGGQWARDIGQNSSPVVRVPLHSCEHHYMVTKAFEGVDSMMPVVRDLDGFICFREWSGGLMTGGFEPVAKPVFHQGIPDKFEFQLLPEDWDQFQLLQEQILHRIPGVANAEVRQLVNGPECFTPDSNWLLGETAEIGNYYIAAGMNSRGIAGAGGIGKQLAEWVIDGEPSENLWIHDIRRFVDVHNNKKFLRERVEKILGAQYTLRYPRDEHVTGRKLRTSPLHTRLEVSGGCFGEIMAYERATWFNQSSEDITYSGTFGKPSWFKAVEEEYWACKEGVCLIDTSSFAKFEIKSAGPEAIAYLQYLCSNDIDQEIGSVVHTGMQNEKGGFENDCSITRLGENHFFMTCLATQQTRALSWLRRHLSNDGSVQVHDVTSVYSGISMIGPHAHCLLADVTNIPTTRSEFKVMTCKVIDVGSASGLLAMRLTHTGEDGFILYIPSEYALHAYDTLMHYGEDHGVRNAGCYAIDHLRIEKSVAYWGADLSADTTPMECGREFRVKLDKGNFIGRDALLKQKEEGLSKKFVQFLLQDFDINMELWPWGGEPIYRNGKFVGQTNTCGYGFTLDHMVCLGYVSDYDEDGNKILKKNINKFVMDKDATYEIDIAGKKFAAKARIYSPSG